MSNPIFPFPQDMKHLLIAMILSLMSVSAALAQSNIDHAIEKIEKRKTTQYVAYSENRHPTSHKVYRASKVLVVDKKGADDFKGALERDRNKSTSLRVTNGRMIEVTFVSGNKTSCYTLVQQRNGSWLLTVDIKNLDNAPGRRRRTLSDEVPAMQVSAEDYLYITI